MERVNTIGRRKTSVARVYLTQGGKGEIIINKRELKDYFPNPVLRTIVNQPLAILDLEKKVDIKINVTGGGVKGQAEAIRLAISRALVENDVENKPALKKEGFLTRDSRMVERKKPGKRKARKSFQWTKR